MVMRTFSSFDMKYLLNKLLGVIYLLLAGMISFLSFFLPQSLVYDSQLRFMLPMILMFISIVLVIHGYFKITEGEKKLIW